MKYDEVSTFVRAKLGDNLRNLRLSTGASQTVLAQMVSIDRSYISQIERGKENVTVDILVKLADGLDVPITDLFAGLGDVPPREQPKKATHYGSVELQGTAWGYGEHPPKEPSAIAQAGDCPPE